MPARRQDPRVPAERPSGLGRAPLPGMSDHRHDALVMLLAWLVSVCLSLFVQPHSDDAANFEPLYYSFYNVAVGALVGFYLFDRVPKDGFALFAVRAASAILFGTLFNETVVEPFVFATGPINGVGFYYGLTDSLSWTAIFLLLRLAEWLHVLGQPLSQEPETRTDRGAITASSGPMDGGADCLFLRVANGTHRIHAADVIYMAAERDFTRVVCVNGEHFVSESLKNLLERSSGFGLTRVHKSFAVNLGRAERLTRAEIHLGDFRVPVGRRYRTAFVEAWRARPAASDSP